MQIRRWGLDQDAVAGVLTMRPLYSAIFGSISSRRSALTRARVPSFILTHEAAGIQRCELREWRRAAVRPALRSKCPPEDNPSWFCAMSLLYQPTSNQPHAASTATHRRMAAYQPTEPTGRVGSGPALRHERSPRLHDCESPTVVG
jgi:hypothetical protein